MKILRFSKDQFLRNKFPNNNCHLFYNYIIDSNTELVICTKIDFLFNYKMEVRRAFDNYLCLFTWGKNTNTQIT